MNRAQKQDILRDNVVTGRFSKATRVPLRDPLQKTEPTNKNLKPLSDKVSSYLDSESKDHLLDTPKTLSETRDVTISLAKDLGIMPQADAKAVGSSVTDSVELRKRIKVLRAELNDNLSELKQQSDKYVRAAKGAKKWLKEAENFSTTHPHLTWLFKRLMHS